MWGTIYLLLLCVLILLIMYRKHLRMSQSQAADHAVIVKSRFIQHLAELPPVFIAWNIATETYHSVKLSNRLLNASLSSFEKAAIFVTRKAEPVVQILEPQLQVVDDLACRGLEKLEQIVPALVKRPESIIRYTRTKYNEIVESGLQKYEDVKLTALSTARELNDLTSMKSLEFLNSPSGQMLVMALNDIFDAYEMYLDWMLPPVCDEGHAFSDREKPPVFRRADVLTERLKERLYKYSLLHLQNLRIRGKLTVYKLYQTNLLHFQVDSM